VKPDSQEASNLSYAPGPSIVVDYNKCSLLPHADQETLLNYASRIDFLCEQASTDLKLVHRKPRACSCTDNQRLPDNLKLG
jgi:hypothetical protein